MSRNVDHSPDDQALTQHTFVFFRPPPPGEDANDTTDTFNDDRNGLDASRRQAWRRTRLTRSSLYISVIFMNVATLFLQVYFAVMYTDLGMFANAFPLTILTI